MWIVHNICKNKPGKQKKVNSLCGLYIFFDNISLTKIVKKLNYQLNFIYSIKNNICNKFKPSYVKGWAKKNLTK